MKKIVLVDIDGTLAKVGDRLELIMVDGKKDWEGFFARCGEDTEYPDIVDLVNTLRHSGYYDLIFCTGRGEENREVTVDWLKKYVFHDADKFTLLMRPENDHRPDTEVKPEMVEKHGIDLYNVAFALEDRNAMVARWRELGITCLQVKDGDY